MPGTLIRRTIDLSGVVQGVGMRPSLYRLARAASLGGWVQNRSGSVRLVLEGARRDVDDFLARLPESLPPHARIESMTVVGDEVLPYGGGTDFIIQESLGGGTREVLIPADLAVCPDCAREIFDPADRRHGYPFTTCTRCGPRYSVLNAMPYDRAQTTMKVFTLCPDCLHEYHDPQDRRFHAESMACPACGPGLWLEDAEGARISGDPVRQARKALARGQTVAVRGIGGYLLAVDALNRDAVKTLRDRKFRPHKPFAVMTGNVQSAARYCVISPEAEELLCSPERPIVIMDVNAEGISGGKIPLDLITPDSPTLGMMLPTTPLHHLLMQPLDDDPVPAFDLLIMTSGNRHGEPICISNEEARQRLDGIADVFLMHDREINLRNDDSVCAVQGGEPCVWRRARGYAPNPVTLAWPLKRVVLAMGADMKNAMAVGYERRVVLSPHVGDLDNFEAIEGFEQVVRTLPDFLGREPEAVAVDWHPDMQSTRLGMRLAGEANLPVVEIQHHHAHAAACLAENGFREGLVLVMDGTGWGGDGTIWGAELLDVREKLCRRHASFAPVPLPGGDVAVRHPARQVVGRWVQAGIELTEPRLSALGVTREEADIWAQQCRQHLNAPLTHAAGRLFDAFSVVLGLAPRDMTYEGQPAIRLEAAARSWGGGGNLPEVPFVVVQRDDLLLIDWAPAFRKLSEVNFGKEDVSRWAMAVHEAIVRAAWAMIESNLSKVPEPRIGLSGGVFMNRIVNERLGEKLVQAGIAVIRHRQTPPGDGCIALGQAVVAGS